MAKLKDFTIKTDVTQGNVKQVLLICIKMLTGKKKKQQLVSESIIHLYKFSVAYLYI